MVVLVPHNGVPMTVEELVKLLSHYPPTAKVWFVTNERGCEELFFHNINAVGTELQVEDFLHLEEGPSGGLAVSDH